ncbi:hybrid sensor histidine kinase/response regulator [Aromatoleum sp.]|uniref:hybrid sensor histidine kinase/response regulator n=1 Tax=Aromatoleum sp. TaxID=2307007 RepID=UPI002FC61209
MTHPTELDLGPLAWVKTEIDAALARADESLDRAERAPDAPTHVQFAQTHLHQVGGALSIVGLDGLTQFALSLDQTLGLLARGEHPVDPATLALARRSLATIGNYLEELVHGTPDQPLRLLSLYREIAAVRSPDAVSPAELFFPDRSVRAPHTAVAVEGLDDDARQQQQRALRATFQRGLLQWLRNGADPAGPQAMLDAVAGVAALHAGTSAATLWYVVQAVLEAILHGDLPPNAEIKRLCSQLDAQLKRLAEGVAAIPDRLLRELLYWTSQAPARTERQRSVRAAWRLDTLIPETGAAVSATPLGPLLKSLQATMSSAKLAWDGFSTGHAADLPRFESLLSELIGYAPQLGRPALDRLLRALVDFVRWLRKDPLRCSEVIALEVATALLLGETALERGAPDAGFSAQVADTDARLRAVMRGEAIAPAESSCTVETARRTQEREALRQLSREILSSLAQVEQILDDYFRNQQKRAPLATLAAPLKQVEGALTLVGDGAAIALVHSAAETIAAFAEAETPPPLAAFEALARQLSALGFYVEALQHGPANLDRFLAPATAAARPGADETSPGTAREKIWAHEAAPAPLPHRAPAEAVDEAVVDLSGDSGDSGDFAFAAQPATAEPSVADLEQPELAAPVAGAAPDVVPEPGFPDDFTLAPALRSPPASGADAAEETREDSGASAHPGADDVLEKTLALLDDIDLELPSVAPTELADTASATAPEAAPQPAADADRAPVTAGGPATPAASASDIDAELLEIFLEEAHDVLATIARLVEVSRRDPADLSQLTGIRRGFHTLKGSGRMVGLRDLGDAAWGLEQTLNRWLQLDWTPTPALHRLIERAHGEFSAWVRALETGGSQARDVALLLAHAERLRSSDAPIVDEQEADVTEPPQITAFETAADETSTAPAAETAAQTPDDLAVPAEARDDAFATGGFDADMMFDFDLELPSAADMPADIAEEAAEPDLVSLDFDDFALPEAAGVGLPAPGDEADLPAEEIALDDDSLPEAEAAPAEADAVEPGARDVADLDAGALFGAEIESSIFDFGDLPESEGNAAPDALPAEVAEDVLPESIPSEPADAVVDVAALPAPAVAEPVAPDLVRIGDTALSRPLYDLYLAEARHHLTVLHAELARLEANPTLVPAEQALRAAHTLTGISGTTRVIAVHGLARALEHAIERLHDHGLAPTPEQAALLNTTNDTLEAMLAEVSACKMPLDVPELAEQLDGVGREVSLETLGEADETLSSPRAPAALAGTTGETQEPGAPAPVVHDDLDAQLLPLFLEEGAELVGELHAALRAWRSGDDADAAAKAVARLLHTLKGSARMAGAMTLGEHMHKLESRLQAGQEAGADANTLIDELVAGLDLAEQMFDRIAAGEPAAPEPSPIESAAAAAGAVAHTESETMAAATTLRVRAEAVDGFVNAAGEIGIARTRIAGELRTMRRALLDLTENVIRLRNQLRDVEIQADVQMQSRITQSGAHDGEFDPLEMDRYTRLQELTRMMAESVGDVTTVQQNLLRNLDATELALNNQARLSRDLQQSLMQVRMVPFDSLADRLHRVVRQTAKELGKRANLDLRGGRIEVDRSVLEHMTAPLEHLLRNAIAHGIETPDMRRDAGKDEIGQITLTVAQEGNEVAIMLADDGGGLDFARIAERAQASGLLAADALADERRLTNLIFIPGFSTAGNLSTVSGRGVGMDVVKSETAAVGGRIDIHSAPGRGTEFRIYLPLTLAVTQALLIRAIGRTYAVPSSVVAQVLELKADALAALQRDGGTDWQGQRFAYRYLPRLLGDRRAQPEPQRFNWVLLLRAGAQTLALHVDALRGNQEIVVKNAGPQLARIVGISGATVLGDGEIVLILNPVALASRGLSTSGEAVELRAVPAEALEPLEPFEAPIDRAPTVMVVDDSLTVRKITGRLLEREGYRVVTAKDGVDALERLIETVPDVILSDIEMPRMDGFDLLRNIRADERLNGIPVVMITSRLADKHRQYAEKIGASHYLGKPYEETELLGLLRQYTGRTVSA